MNRVFTLEFWEDDGWYVGRLAEVPGVFSQGQTLDELQTNIADAYRLLIDDDVAPSAPSTVQTKEIRIAI